MEALILQLVVQYGIPGMLEIIALVKKQGDPNHEEWMALHTKWGTKKAETYLAEAILRAAQGVQPQTAPGNPV